MRLMTNGSRWRMVTSQNGKEHISSVILAEPEIDEMLAIEAHLHRKAGWTVTESNSAVIARKSFSKGQVERIMTVREFLPLEDKPARVHWPEGDAVTIQEEDDGA